MCFIQFSINCFGNDFQLQQRITVSVLIVSGINIEIRFPGYQNVTLTVLVFRPELISYERSRRETAAKFHHFSARIFFVKISESQDSMIYCISVFSQGHIPKMDAFPMLFSRPTRLPVRPSWITGYQTGSCSSISQFTGYQTDSFSSISQFTSYQTGSCSSISQFKTESKWFVFQ